MRIYTVDDIISKYSILLRYCLKLTRFNVQDAEDLLHDTIASFITKEAKEFERDYHFLCYIEKSCKFRFLENIRRKKLDVVENNIDYYLDQDKIDVEYDQNLLGSYKSNLEVYNITKNLSYSERKMLFELTNGYTKKELIKNYNLSRDYFIKLLSKFDGEIFIDNRRHKDINDTLSKLTNDKHKRIYKLYLDKVSLNDIVERTNTPYSTVEQIIYRIKKKYDKKEELQSI